MSNNLFKDLALTASQIESNYPLRQLNVLNNRLQERLPDPAPTNTNVVVGLNTFADIKPAGSNIVIGNDNTLSSTNVKVLDAVDNAIVIGNGEFKGDHKMQNGAVAIGKDITMPDPNVTNLVGCLIFGDNFANVGNGVTAVGAGSSNSSIKIYYKGAVKYIPLFDAAP